MEKYPKCDMIVRRDKDNDFDPVTELSLEDVFATPVLWPLKNYRSYNKQFPDRIIALTETREFLVYKIGYKGHKLILNSFVPDGAKYAYIGCTPNNQIVIEYSERDIYYHLCKLDKHAESFSVFKTSLTDHRRCAYFDDYKYIDTVLNELINNPEKYYDKLMSKIPGESYILHRDGSRTDSHLYLYTTLENGFYNFINAERYQYLRTCGCKTPADYETYEMMLECPYENYYGNIFERTSEDNV